jgi:carnitine-CoA ligase
LKTYDAATGLTLHHVVAQRATEDPDRLFCEFGATPHTHGELEQGVSAYAHGLVRAGLRPGDRAAVFMANRFEYFLAMLGVQRVGGTYVPCSTLYSADEVRYLLEHSGATVVFADASTSERLAEALGPGAAVRVVAQGFERSGALPLSDLPDWSAGPFPVRLDEDTAAMIMYTSGTTARPKGVIYTHANLMHAAQTNAAGLGWQPDDRLLHYFPLHHNNGGVIQLGPPLLRGAALVMVDKFSASRFGDQLHEHRITFAAVNSTHARMILANPPKATDADHPCRRMMLGLTLDAESLAAFESRFNTRCITTYGLTESLGVVAYGSRDYRLAGGSSGRPIPGYELRAVDDAGQDVPEGEPGEILVRSTTRHGLSAGYWRDEEATAALFADGWLHSGDIGRFDELGAIHFVQRKKDMIKRSGFNVAPAEVERALGDHPAVAEAVVVGIPDEWREEAIIAFVIASEAVAEEDVIEHCRRLLAAYKVPERVVFVEAMPMDVLGKVDRKRLRVLAAG